MFAFFDGAEIVEFGLVGGRVDEGADEGRSDKRPAWRSRAENIVVIRRTSEGWGCMLIEI